MSRFIVGKVSPAVALIALAALLSGCYLRSMGDTWSLHVFAQVGSEAGPEEMICQGSMSANIQFAGGPGLTALATPDQPYDQVRLKHDGAINPGQSVTIEALCTDEVGNEVGYILVEGRVKVPDGFKQNASTSVWPWTESGSSSGFCLEPTITRGLSPCVSDTSGSIQLR